MMRLNLFIIFLFIGVLFFPFVGWSEEIAPNTEVSKYKRIVALKPNITMILHELGVQSEIVGITKFCPRPNDEALIVGDYNSIDVEQVLRLKPDLVLISPENSQSRQYETLLNAKLNVKIYNFKTYEELKLSITEMAKLLGIRQRGEQVVGDMEAKLDLLFKKNTAQGPVVKSYIMIVQRHPLMVASSDTYISTLFGRAGFKNAFGPNKVAYPVVDEEEVIREIVDYTFDVSHRPEAEADNEFLNKTVIPLNTQDFVAAPQSVDQLVKLLSGLKSAL